ncbi:MAG: monovalent cation/H+ antiporter subunit D family protein [Alphaproteobacteria bacterium]|nr:monovalent cation/H+ antiporter subunit D family protein [Alphaproteobacteria bacterium]
MDIFANLLPAELAHHVPVLVVVIPLIAAALAAIMPNGRAGWTVAIITASIVALFSLVLLAQALDLGVISYALGGWAPPIGIEYRVDALNAVVLALVGLVGLLCVIYSLPSVADEIEEGKQALFYSAFLVCFAGLLGVTITGDAFNVFVFLEISSISTYTIIAMGASKDRRALTAAYNYLILGTIGATFFVIGVGFLYAATGTLNMADMARILQENGHDRVTEAAFAFIVVGLGLKAAMFPLHVWLPNAYAFAPNFVTAFLASTATKVAFYALIRFLFSVYHPDTAFVQMSFTWVFAVVGVIAMFVASAQAIFQTDARRLLAYSSVAQVGYMMLGLGMGTVLGLQAGILHLINHALMKGALFMALGAFALNFGVRQVADLAGLGRTMPASAMAFTIAGLSLVGVPLTVGFDSKWYLILAALERDWWWAVAALILSSLMALIYIGRMIMVVWMEPVPAHPGAEVKPRHAPYMMLIPTGIIAFANIYFFFDASLLVSLSGAAAQAVMGG